MGLCVSLWLGMALKFILGQEGSKNIKGVGNSEGWWDQHIGGSGGVRGWLRSSKEVSWKDRRMHEIEIMEGLQLCVITTMG